MAVALDAVNTGVGVVSTIASTLNTIVDTASKAYDLSIKIHDAKEIDTVGVHIGPVYRENWDANSTWTQNVAFAFHRKNGSTMDHPFHIRITLNGSEADDPWERCSKHLEHLQATIISRITNTSIDKLFNPAKSYVPSGHSKKGESHQNENGNGKGGDESSAKKADDEKKSSHGCSDSGLSTKVDPESVRVPSGVEPKGGGADASDFAAAASAVSNILQLERSFDSKRTNVLSRIALVVDTVLGSVVPSHQCVEFQKKLYYQFEHFLNDVASVKNISNVHGKHPGSDPDGEINLQMEITIK